MEIQTIDELKQAPVAGQKEVQLNKAGGKKCLYCDTLVCSAPKQLYAICKNCPRVQMKVVRSVFDHVKALAILLLNSMGMNVAGGQGTGGGTGTGGGA